MKFSALSLFLLSSIAYGQDEIALMEAKKAPRVHHGSVKEGMCHNKPLNANMLIARVSISLSLMNDLSIYLRYKISSTPPVHNDNNTTQYGMNITDPDHASALAQAINGNLQLGSITQHISEASDASRVGALVLDGVSGDVNFPHGNIKPVMTVGEINMCEENHGDVVSKLHSILSPILLRS